MGIFRTLVMELFNSGRAIGVNTKITGATGWLRRHSKAVGEELSNALRGNAKSINDKLIKCDLYDKFFAHIDDVAKQYPDATVQVAAKSAKKGGFKVAKVTVKNGDNVIYNQAVSIANDGTIKTKASGMGSEMSEFINAQGMRAVAKSDVGTVKASYNAAQKSGQVELSHGGEQVAIANYINRGGNSTRGGVNYETVDNLVSGQMYYNGHEVSFLGNSDGLKQWGTRYQAQVAKQKEELEPLTLQLLRPLRERFNTAIDLFKYNGKTNHERFVSKDELYKSIKELQGEVVSLEKIKQARQLSNDEFQYLRQIKTDIDYGKELIEITV